MQQKQADLGYRQGLVIFFLLLGPTVKNKIHAHPPPLHLISYVSVHPLSSDLNTKFFFIIYSLLCTQGASLVAQTVKNLPARQEIPVRPLGLGRHLGERNDNALQCSCLKNSLEKGTWWATAHRVARVRHDWNDLAYIHSNLPTHSRPHHTSGFQIWA